MGLAFEIVSSARTVVFTAQGNVDYKEGLETLKGGLSKAATTEPSVRWHLLFDLSHSHENRSGDDLRSIASIIRSWKDNLSGACALVAADELHYGLSRMFGAYLEQGNFNINVFSTRNTAEEWLDGLR